MYQNYFSQTTKINEKSFILYFEFRHAFELVLAEKRNEWKLTENCLLVN